MCKCIPDTSRCILVLLAHLHERLLTTLQRCKAAKYTLNYFQSKIFLYGSMEWNMEENFSMEWNMEWKIFGMEWKKIASMEYGKIVFHSIPCPALEREVWGSNLGKSNRTQYCQRLATAATLRKKLCCPGAMTWRWAPTTRYTLRRITPRIMKDLNRYI